MNDPYAGNVLIQGLGPVLSRQQVLRKLNWFPPLPAHISQIPKEARLHQLMQMRDFHLASLEGARIYQTIDLMLRPSYGYRNPVTAHTWGVLSGEAMPHKTPRAPAMAAAVVGIAGTGKTEAILRAFHCLAQQVIIHKVFPRLVGQHAQVVWQTADVPASGKAADLAANLMLNWDMTMAEAIPDRPARFAAALAQKRRDGAQMLDEWRQVAMSHFLGVLHLDEVQNFFKLPRLEKRTKRVGRDGHLELTIVEDQCLKWVLTLTNTWQIPLIISGTPDGVEALGKRLSNIQRLASAGFHHLQPFSEDHADGTWQLFFAQLAQYQYVAQPLPADEELSNLVMELTAGVPRIIIALWIAAHRVAFERLDDDLRLADFRKAAATFLSPLAPAVAALRSHDPARLSRYQDLLPGEESWAQYWEYLP